MTLQGIVVQGTGRGQKQVVPTMNIVMQVPPKLEYGVYAVRIRLDHKYYGGVANYGIRPTFGDTTRPVFEVHALDAEGDWYGKRVHVAVLQKLREERVFDSSNELKEQIQRDIREARRLFPN